MQGSKALMTRSLLAMALLLMTSGHASALDYSGKYADEQVTLELAPVGDGYAGTLSVGGKTYPVKAREEAGKLKGTFTVAQTPFEFTATLEGRALTLTSGSKQYNLVGQAKPINPLEQMDPVNAATNPSTQPVGQIIEPVSPPPPDQPPVTVKSDQAVIDKLSALPKGPANRNREWTVLVYLNADNDLEPFGVQDMNEMERGFGGDNVEFIVLFDRHKAFDKTDGDWTGTRVYRVRPDQDMAKVNSDLLLDLGEANCGDPKVLQAFLTGALKAYPARQHALIMWNHGSGWSAMSSDDDAPGNSSNHDDVKLTELREAIEMALPAAGLKKLQIVGFDMCLMSQIEVATELAEVAEVMVASQALEPGFGWPYDVVVPAFAKGTAGARRIGTDIVSAFDEFYKTVRKEDETTLAALDLSAVADFNAALDKLIAKYEPTLRQNWPTLARSIYYGEQYAARSDYRAGKNAFASFDILDVVKRLKYATEGFPAEQEYRDVMSAADRLVIVSANSDRRKLSNGVAIYAPVRADMLKDDYSQLRFAKSSAWPGFLKSLHTNVDADPSQPKIEAIQLLDETGKPTDVALPLEGCMFQFKLTGNNVIYTHAYTGRRSEQLGGLVIDHKALVIDPLWILRFNEGAAHAIDMLMPKYKDGANDLRDTFEGMGVVITNGNQRSTSTFDGTDLDLGGIWMSQCLLEHPGLGDKPVPGMIQWNNSLFVATSVIALMPQPDGSLLPRKLEPTPDLIVTPLHEVITDDGRMRLATSQPLAWQKGLSLIVELMPPGDYETIFRAETMNGKAGAGRLKYKIAHNARFAKLSETWQRFREDFIPGVWEVRANTAEGLKPMWKLKLSPVDGGYYLAEIEEVQTGKQHKMLTTLDRRGLPHIRMIELLEGGKIGSTIFGPAVFFLDENNRPQLEIQFTSMGGINTVWSRKEPIQGGPGPGNIENADRFVPVETPDPKPLQSGR